MSYFSKLSQKTVHCVLSRSLMFFCTFCELFLLAFILSYVLYQNLLTVLLVVAGLLGLVFNIQDLFVYHPQEPPESKYYIEQPSIFNLPFESVYLLTCDSVRLHSYLLKQTRLQPAQVPTIVFFHGNAGNIGQRLSLAHYLYHVCECNVFLVEYRGYGISEGSASESGFYLDAEASIKYLHTRSDIDSNKIIVLGQSIGGAVAIDLASRFNERLMAVIVENSFTSLPDIGRELFSDIPGFQFLPDFFFKNQYQSIQKVKNITIPGLFISGQADQMIPPKMMKLLFDKSNCTIKRLLKLETGNHNNTWLCPGYFQFISKFIQEVQADINTTTINKTLSASLPTNSQIWHVSAAH